jgi:hypothetical protein
MQVRCQLSKNGQIIGYFSTINKYFYINIIAHHIIACQFSLPLGHNTDTIDNSNIQIKTDLVPITVNNPANTKQKQAFEPVNVL